MSLKEIYNKLLKTKQKKIADTRSSSAKKTKKQRKEKKKNENWAAGCKYRRASLEDNKVRTFLQLQRCQSLSVTPIKSLLNETNHLYKFLRRNAPKNR